MKFKNILLMAVFSLASISVQAATIDFGILAPTTGTLSYAGGAAPLIGSNIEIDNIVGLSTPLNASTAITCDSCVLEFTTGANISGWNFASGGIISIVGGVSAAGIAPGTTLLSGIFNSAIVVDVGSIQIAGASFSDIKDENLLAYFGMPLGDYIGGLNLSFQMSGTPTAGDAFTSLSLQSGDVTNDPVVVPVPAAIWLFGTGLLGLVSVARRKVA